LLTAWRDDDDSAHWVLNSNRTFQSVTLHIYWALGGKRGLAAAIPSVEDQPLFEPGFADTLLIAVLLLAAAFLVLGNLYGLPFLPVWIYPGPGALLPWPANSGGFTTSGSLNGLSQFARQIPYSTRHFVYFEHLL